MKNARLLIIAVVLVAIAMFLKQSNKPAAPSDPLIGHSLVTAAEIDQINEFSMLTDQGEIKVKKQNGEWRLPAYHGLKARPQRIEELFQKMNQARIAEMVTANEQRHNDLGVAQIADGSSVSGFEKARIQLKNDQGAELKTLYFGNGRKARNVDGSESFNHAGQYFRYGNSQSVYLINEMQYFEKSNKNWASNELFKIAASQVKQLNVNKPEPEAAAFTVQREKPENALALSEVPEDQQMKAAVVDAAVRIFEPLTFDEIIATDSPALHPELVNGISASLETFSGLKLDLKISSGPVSIPGIEAMNIVSISAVYEGTDPAMKALAEELNGYAEKLLFGMREFRIKPLIVNEPELLEPKPAPAPESTSETAAATDKVSASHILIAYKGADRSQAERTEEEAKKLAEELLEKIKGGEELGKLASENSDCPSGKSASGSLGEFGRGMMAKEFEDAAFGLEVGGISGIVKTGFGYHIIRRDK